VKKKSEIEIEGVRLYEAERKTCIRTWFTYFLCVREDENSVGASIFLSNRTSIPFHYINGNNNLCPPSEHKL
jgi:hypothetical protein